MLEASSRVLICLVNRPRDLEIARWEHWYRIPVEQAPDEYLADYLAFYLTEAFEDEKWAIHEYAAVRGHELVRRADLFPGEPDHPRAKALYFKMQLGPLLRLPRPVPSLRWRRITFIQTTGERLLNALEVGELAAHSRHYIRLMEDAESGVDVDESLGSHEPKDSSTSDSA